MSAAQSRILSNTDLFCADNREYRAGAQYIKVGPVSVVWTVFRPPSAKPKDLHILINKKPAVTSSINL